MNLKEGQTREYLGPKQGKYRRHIINREGTCWCNPTIVHVGPRKQRVRRRILP